MSPAPTTELNLREGDANLRIVPTNTGGLQFQAAKGDTTATFTLPSDRLKELQSLIAQAIIGDPESEARERSM